MRVFIVICLFATVANAEWSKPQVRKWVADQGVTNDTTGVIVSADDGIQGGWDAAWGSQPTLAQVEAVDYATALTWSRAENAAKQAAEIIVIEPPSDHTSYGTAEKPIAELHVSTNTVYVGGQAIRADGNGLKLNISTNGTGFNPNGQLQQKVDAILKALGWQE